MTNIEQLTIGLDLGDKISKFCVLDANRKIVRSDGVATSPESFEALFAAYPGATLVFEVGSQSRWVQSLARASGLGKVITADPRQIKLITHSRNKTDQRDAHLLARIGQGLSELLSQVEHRRPAKYPSSNTAFSRARGINTLRSCAAFASEVSAARAPTSSGVTSTTAKPERSADARTCR